MKLMSWDNASLDAALFQPEAPEGGELLPAVLKNDFVSLCYGDVDVARRLFERCEWERPEAVLAALGGYEYFAFDTDPRWLETRRGPMFNRAIVTRNADVGEYFEVKIINGGIDDDVLSDVNVTTDGRPDMTLVMKNLAPIREWLEATFEKTTMEPLAAPFAMTAVFSPRAEVAHHDFTHVVAFAHNGDSAAQIPPERFEVYSMQALGPFQLQTLHAAFKAAMASSDVRMIEIDAPSQERAIARAEQALCERLAGDKTLQRLVEPAKLELEMRVNDYLEAYGPGVAWAGMSSNRGYAYVGPIIGESRFHYFQLDHVSDAIVRHFKLEFPETPKVGSNYSVVNKGGTRLEVTKLSQPVADALVDKINCVRQGVSVVCEGPLTFKRQPSFLEHDAAPEFDVMFGDAIVGTARPGSAETGPAITPVTIPRKLADVIAMRGVDVCYRSDGFHVATGELEKFAFQQCGWFEPTDAISASIRSVWDQKRETGYPRHKSLIEL